MADRKDGARFLLALGRAEDALTEAMHCIEEYQGIDRRDEMLNYAWASLLDAHARISNYTSGAGYVVRTLSGDKPA